MKDDNQQGKIHPLSLLIDEAYSVFAEMGFEIATGPELESEWNNFDVLNEATDFSHEMQFYQIDGGMIGENISLANLKGVLTHFYKKMLGDDVKVEFRPSFFPFTEPSIEVFAKFNGKWLEMMGAGMAHPNVLRNIGLDPKKYQCLLFGGGFDRIAMVKWKIPDIRLIYQGDLRLNQF